MHYLSLRAALSPAEHPSLDAYFVHKKYQDRVKRIQFFVDLRIRAKLWYGSPPADAQTGEPIKVFVYAPSRKLIEERVLTYAKIRRNYQAVEFPAELKLAGLDDFYLVERRFQKSIKQIQASRLRLDPALEKALLPPASSAGASSHAREVQADSTVR